MEKSLKILSWNINGLRASKTHFQNLIQSQSYDIVCFQETKLTRDQLDEDVAVIEGYNSYYSFSRKRSGYSGVATICKDTCIPIGAEEGLSSILQAKLSHKDGVGHYGDYEHFAPDELNALDNEGRALITLHKIRLSEEKDDLLAVINVYCPRADCEKEDRQNYKIRFYELLELRANAIRQSGSHVIIVGDINTSHKLIDTCWPLADGEEFPKTDGREWLNRFLNEPPNMDDDNQSNTKKGHHFIDTFRHFFPDRKNAYTCWCTKTGARSTNYGTRLDYIFADKVLVDAAFVDSNILPEMEGSDHCPIVGVLQCEAIAATKAPSLCTKFYPEFSGKQQKLVTFFSKQALKSAADENLTSAPPRKRLCTQAAVKTNKVGKSVSQKKLTSFFCAPKVGESKTDFVRKFDLVVSNSSDETERNGHSETQNDDVWSSQEDNLASSQSDASYAFTESKTNKSSSAALLWKNVFQAPAVPKCKGHEEACVVRTVKKPGPNCGRQFYVCARPEGLATNPDARCDFFVWKKKLD